MEYNYLWRPFLHRSETLNSCYTHPKVPWYIHCDITMETQAPGPLHSKGKIRVFLLLLLFIQCLWANMEITQHKHKEVCETREQQIRHFSFKVEIWQQVCFYGDFITTITMCSFCSRSTLQNFNPVDLCPHCDVKSPLICINQNLEYLGNKECYYNKRTFLITWKLFLISNC